MGARVWGTFRMSPYEVGEVVQRSSLGCGSAAPAASTSRSSVDTAMRRSLKRDNKRAASNESGHVPPPTATRNRSRKSPNVFASAAGLSSRHRTMRGKRTAIPDL